jgi:signal transduction histidine kinase
MLLNMLSQHLCPRIFVVIFYIILCSCTSKPSRLKNNNTFIYKQLRLADSTIAAGKKREGMLVLARIRKDLDESHPSIVNYYCITATWTNQWGINNSYADSALSYFNSDARKKNFPAEYYKALIAKGESCIYLKQYNQAIKYYYIAKKIFSVGNCEDGDLGAKIARIYYSQRNYRMAAQLWAEGVHSMSRCQNATSYPTYFYTMQSLLDNCGLSYAKAGMADSANYYLLKDVELINAAEQKHIDVRQARISVYDNLGGLNLNSGRVANALGYLRQSVTIPLNETDGIKIPPYIKLAQAYMQLKNYPQVLTSLQQARIRLDRFPNSSDQEVLWHKTNAQYLYQTKKGDKAYESLLYHIKLKDSLEHASTDVFRLDVDREQKAMYQQQAFHDLSDKNKIRRLYLAGAIISAVLTLIILLLIYRNLKRSQKMHKESESQNRHLQQAMDELTRANDNYIRIMRVMAHDIRNPLSGMTGLANVLLAEDDLSNDNRHMLQLIKSTGIHSMEMISELLKSGLSDEFEPISTGLVDLKALLYESVELLRFKAMEKNQKIIFEGSEGRITAQVSHEKIWRVFNNLIVNAIKFSHNNSQIKASIIQVGRKITITIADSGIGIPDKDKNAVFEMFTPIKKPGTQGEQSFGLGLSISKRIIGKHNGKIWFSSQEGVGTTFYIELPYSDH